MSYPNWLEDLRKLEEQRRMEEQRQQEQQRRERAEAKARQLLQDEAKRNAAKK